LGLLKYTSANYYISCVINYSNINKLWINLEPIQFYFRLFIGLPFVESKQASHSSYSFQNVKLEKTLIVKFHWFLRFVQEQGQNIDWNSWTLIEDGKLVKWFNGYKGVNFNIMLWATLELVDLFLGQSYKTFRRLIRRLAQSK
jgi:hypothetical protein